MRNIGNEHNFTTMCTHKLFELSSSDNIHNVIQYANETKDGFKRGKSWGR